uniref:Transporter n=1 Tax=Sinonovacula rivularis TaxID=489091 RepID=A0AA49X8H5_9BIVA|nr:AAT8 [Sinonovacula rivularis]
MYIYKNMAANAVNSENMKGESRGKKHKFGSSVTTIVVLLGYSLGSSDFWKFPFLVYRNGGGSFLIPYVVTLALCGCPLYFFEYSLGVFSGKGPYKVWDLCPLYRGCGVSVVMLYIGYLITGSILRCWLIEFFVNSFRDPLPWSHCNNDWNTEECRDSTTFQNFKNGTVYQSHLCNNLTVNGTANCLVNGSLINTTVIKMTATEEFWQYSVLHLSSGISDLTPVVWRLVLYMAILRIVLSLIIIRSIKWLEKVMYFTTFIPLIISAILLIRSLTQPGASDGIYHYFKPNLLTLGQPRVWLEAALMAFYTLSFGWGCIIFLGSHTKFHDNSFRTSIITPYLDALCPIFTGMVCFSVLGNMAHTLDVPVTKVIRAEMSSGLVGFASALSRLPFPQLWSALFFFSVIITSVDNQSVAMEMAVQCIGEMFPNLFPKHRRVTLAILTVVIFVASLPTCTGAGVYIFLLNDWYSCTWLSPILELGQLLVVAWIYGLDRYSYDVSLMLGRPLPGWYRISIAFVCPAVVVVIFVTSILKYVPPTYGIYHFSSLSQTCGWLSICFIFSPIPIYIAYSLSTGQGHWTERLRRLMQPNPSHGPCDEQAIEKYVSYFNVRRRYDARSTFLYNMCGRSSTVSEETQNEMQELNRANC